MDELAIYYCTTKYKLRWLLVYSDNTADEFVVDLRVDPEYMNSVKFDPISTHISLVEFKALSRILT